MPMKKLIISIFLCLSALFSGAQVPGTEDLLVTMPVPPDNLTNLTQRCNYIVERYWKTFNPKSSFSNLDHLNKTMGQFFAVVPYASADTVKLAVDRLTQAVGKAKAENLITLAKIAERWTGADTSQYLSDELYMMFLEPVLSNKKAKGPERARFEAQYRKLKNSSQGAVIQDFDLTLPDGSVKKFSEVAAAPHRIIFFYDPDCTDCRLAKARLSADFVVDGLVKGDVIDIIAIYPGEPDDAWRADAETLPKNWIVGAYPDADRYFTMRNQPEIYYLDGNNMVVSKDVQVEGIMNGFRQLLIQAGQKTDAENR